MLARWGHPTAALGNDVLTVLPFPYYTAPQFVFGDMNYRMRLSAEQVVHRVAATARALQASVWCVHARLGPLTMLNVPLK